jgi:hypothetical protein
MVDKTTIWENFERYKVMITDLCFAPDQNEWQKLSGNRLGA